MREINLEYGISQRISREKQLDSTCTAPHREELGLGERLGLGAADSTLLAGVRGGALSLAHRVEQPHHPTRRVGTFHVNFAPSEHIIQLMRSVVVELGRFEAAAAPGPAGAWPSSHAAAGGGATTTPRHRAASAPAPAPAAVMHPVWSM